jgi:hypothetical protein
MILSLFTLKNGLFHCFKCFVSQSFLILFGHCTCGLFNIHILESLQNIDDIRNGRRTKVPIFDLESGARSGFKELEVSEDCGVVSH